MPNGLGPKWFPVKIREKLTSILSFFFDEASWDKHDEGYERGYPARWLCDLRFLQAMLRDATISTSTLGTFLRILISILLWFLVRIGGWYSYTKK